MVDFVTAVLLGAVILATVLVMMLAFPHVALVVIPLAIGLMIPFLPLLIPLVLAIYIPLALFAQGWRDWKAWRARRALRRKQVRVWYEEPPLLTLDDIFGRG